MFRTLIDQSRQRNLPLRQWACGLPSFARRCLLAALVLLVPALALLAPPLRPARAQEATAPTAPASPAALSCNGYEWLCDRRYDQVTYPSTHNSHSIYPHIYSFWNQERNFRLQLTDGIRGMMVDIYEEGGGKFCHDSCVNGYISLSDGLGDIKWFLDNNPNEVLTLIIEAYAKPDFMVAAFRAAGLEQYAYTYNGNRWPTLREMIASNKRLVVMTNNLEKHDLSHQDYSLDPRSGGYHLAPWLHSEWRRASETPYGYAAWLGPGRSMGYDKPGYCAVDRGSGNGLFILNHFVQPVNPSASGDVNKIGYLGPSAFYCLARRNRPPNFVAVDHYTRGGGVFGVNQDLNYTALICPDDIVVDAAPGASGANVTFPPLSADGSIHYETSPPSGSFFPIGATLVTAHRSYGVTEGGYAMSQTCTFYVRVRRPVPLEIYSNLPNPAFPNEQVTFSYSGWHPYDLGGLSPHLTGTVTIKNGNEVICSGSLTPGLFNYDNGSCKGTFSTEGDKNIVAVYSGDPVYSPATSAPVIQQVRRFRPTMTVESSLNPAHHGRPVTITAEVKAADSGGAIPQGMVTLYLSGGGGLAEMPLVDGVATFTFGGEILSFLEVGAYTMTAYYAGNNYFSDCTGALPGQQVVVCPVNTIGPASLAGAQALVPYSQTVTSTLPADNRYFYITEGYLPPGLNFDNNTGVLSGVPLAAGTLSFTVVAADLVYNGCAASRNFTLGITCPTITLSTLPDAASGQAYSQTITATPVGGNYKFAVTAGALPPGLTLNTLTGLVSGTPASVGTYNFTIKATGIRGFTGPPDEIGNFTFVEGVCNTSRAYSLTINPTVVTNGLQFYPLSKPLRLLDTRAGQLGCDTPGAQIPGNTSRTQPARRTCDGLTIPAGARAVTGNITTVQSGGGYLTLYPSDAAQPLVANSNYAANEIVNNVFTVGLGDADGSFKIFVTSNTDVVVDITGYYAPPSVNGLYFHPLPKPIRLLDTRAGFSGAFTPGAKLQANADTPQQACVTYDGVTIPSTALAIVGNATTLNGGVGYLTLSPGGAARPLAASSNFSAGQAMNAPFTVGLSASGEFNIFTTTGIDAIIDVLGYYSTDANDANGTGLLFTPLSAPVRLLETRAGFTGCYTPNAPLARGSTRQQQARGACGGQTIAAGALSIVGNATVVNNQAGYLTFWPNGALQPLVASSNFAAGQVLNRHFTVGLGAEGMFNIFASAQTDLIVDVSGFFAP